MVRKVAIRGLTAHPSHVNPLCFHLISCGIAVTCNRCVGFLSSWLFLIIWSKNVFGRQQRFFTATTKISAVSGKNQKKEHQEGIGMYIICTGLTHGYDMFVWVISPCHVRLMEGKPHKVVLLVISWFIGHLRLQ